MNYRCVKCLELFDTNVICQAEDGGYCLECFKEESRRSVQAEKKQTSRVLERLLVLALGASISWAYGFWSDRAMKDRVEDRAWILGETEEFVVVEAQLRFNRPLVFIVPMTHEHINYTAPVKVWDYDKRGWEKRSEWPEIVHETSKWIYRDGP